MRRPTALVPALLLVVVAAGSAGCAFDGSGESGPRRLEAGESVPAFGTVTPRSEARVPLPSGTLTLALSGEVTGPQDAGVSGEVEPADGSHLLGLAWSRSDPDVDPELHEVLTGKTLEDAGATPDLEVVVDGARYPLRDVGVPGHQHGALWVAVPDGVATIEVGYDGLTQTVDPATGAVESGPAVALAHPSNLPHDGAACDPADFPRAYVLDVDCRVERWYDVPYAAPLGWASDGRTWIVADIVVKGRPTVTLDGKRGRDLPASTALMDRLAFQVPARQAHRLSFDFGARIGTQVLRLG